MAVSIFNWLIDILIVFLKKQKDLFGNGINMTVSQSKLDKFRKSFFLLGNIKICEGKLIIKRYVQISYYGFFTPPYMFAC